MAIPTRDEDLRAFAVNLLTQCDTNKTAWSIDAASLGTAQTLSADYSAKLAVCRTPDRRKSDVVAKNEAKKALSGELRFFIGKNLDYNEAITDPIRESLGLPIRDRVKTPVLRPLLAPVAYVEVKGARVVELHFKAEGAAGSGRPRGYHGAVIRYGILDEPPGSAEDLPKSLLATRTPYVFEFTEADRGRKVYFALAWETNSGLLGVFSEVFPAIVP